MMPTLHPVNSRLLIVVDGSKCQVLTADKPTINRIVTTLGQTIEGKATPPPVLRPGRKPRWPREYKIHIVAKGNPKRPGTYSHAEWEQYREGMTIADYAAALEAAPIGTGSPKARAYAGVVHDARKGLIQVLSPRRYANTIQEG